MLDKHYFTENLQMIYDLADKFGIMIISAEENAAANGATPNQMFSAGSTIFLNEFDDPDLELAAFFHELGHVESSRSVLFNNLSPCKLSQEALAWEIGFGLAKAHGFNWDYYSKQYEYARSCLFSYLHHEGNFGGFR